MGRKGVSKRKPKKDKSNVSVSTTSDVRMGDSPSVQALVKDKDTSFNRGGTNPYTGSNKKGKKDRR
jgi:hypothetical protein